MFFGVQILGKKRPLSTAWLLGCGRKITKRKIMKEDILKTCDMIMSPVVPLALRLSAILMSGVIMIFHQKQQYILDEAFGAIRSARQRGKHRDGATTTSLSNKQATSRTARTETTVTFRSNMREETVNEVSKHVEEIFLQEFLSTQPESSDLRLSVDKRSLEYFSSGSGLKTRDDSSLSHNPSLGSGGAGPQVMGSSLDSQLDLQLGGDTFLPEGDEAMQMEAAAAGSEHNNDDLMKDFFFTDQRDQSQSQDLSHPHQPQASSDQELGPRLEEDIPQEDRNQEEEGAQALAHGAGGASVGPKRKGRKRKRGQRQQRIHVDGSEITIPRETIRNWLRDVSDIICTRPVYERKRIFGAKDNKAKLQKTPASASVGLQEDLKNLLDLFSEDSPVPSSLEAADAGAGLAAADDDVARDANIEMEVLRQEDGSAGHLSPRGVSDGGAIFNTSSSEEDRRDQGEAVDQDAFLQSLPEILLPPTDDFVLPETNEAEAGLGSPLDRQYENISFSPLRLPSQPSQPTDGSPHNYSGEAAERVLDFYAAQQEGEGGSLSFGGLMRAHGVKRADVARVFFLSLVLHSKGLVTMTQNNGADILVTLAP